MLFRIASIRAILFSIPLSFSVSGSDSFLISSLGMRACMSRFTSSESPEEDVDEEMLTLLSLPLSSLSNGFISSQNLYPFQQTILREYIPSNKQPSVIYSKTCTWLEVAITNHDAQVVSGLKTAFSERGAVRSSRLRCAHLSQTTELELPVLHEVATHHTARSPHTKMRTQASHFSFAHPHSLA